MVFVLDFNYLRKVTRLLYNQREIYLASLVIWHADIREDRVPVMDFDSFPKQGFFKTTRTFLASLMTSYEEVLEMKSNISWASSFGFRFGSKNNRTSSRTFLASLLTLNAIVMEKK